MKFISRASEIVRNSYWLKSGAFSMMSKVSTTLFGFVNFYILIRILSKEDFGAWVLFFSVANFMELIKHGFVRNPLIRFLAAASDEDSPKVQTASLYLNIIIAAIEIFLLILCSIYLSEFWSSPQLKSLFLIYILSTIALIPANHFDVVQHAKLQFKGPFFSTLARQLGLFIYVLIVFIFGFTIELDSMAYAQFIAISFSAVVSFITARHFLHNSKTLDKKWIAELFHYGKFTFGTNVSSTILKSVDTWMLGKLISPASVAIFNPALRISNLVEVPTDALTSILFPQLSKRIATEGLDAAKYLYEKSVGTLSAIMLPVVLFVIVFASPIVNFIAGPGFEETVPILQITMLFGLIIPFNRLLGIVFDAIGKAKTNFRFTLQNALINIVSNFFYISHFGIIGAAYGTLTTYIIALVYNQVYLHRHLGVRISGVFGHFFDFYAKLFSLAARFIAKIF